MANIRIDGDIDELCAQINSGEAAEGYARLRLRVSPRARRGPSLLKGEGIGLPANHHWKGGAYV